MILWGFALWFVVVLIGLTLLVRTIARTPPSHYQPPDEPFTGYGKAPEDEFEVWK